MEVHPSEGIRKFSEAEVAKWRQQVLEGRGCKNETPIEFHEQILYASGIATCVSLIAIGTTWLVTHWASVRPGWSLSLSLIAAGVYLADLFSGILHWAFDTWFDEKAPFLRMVVPVREHHIHPQRILKLTFYENIGIASWQGVVLTGPGLVLLSLIRSPSVVQFSGMMVLIVATAGLLVMFVLHQQAHNFRAARWIRILRAMRLILDPHKHLSDHHRGRHDQDYCLINGWVDKTLGRAGFWRALEWLVSALTGSIPRRDDELWLRQFNRGRKAQSSRREVNRGAS
jgi:ubiquitin-conjugating enzyme E2 variant